MSRLVALSLTLSLVLANLLGSLAPVHSQELTAAEEVCEDGIDNDGDGLIDEDCPTAAPTGPEPVPPADDPPPAEEICDDGLDNDGDGAIDEACPTSVPPEPILAEPRHRAVSRGPRKKCATTAAAATGLLRRTARSRARRLQRILSRRIRRPSSRRSRRVATV